MLHKVLGNLYILCTAANPPYTLYADGEHDDTLALQALLLGKHYMVRNFHLVDISPYGFNGNYRSFLVSDTLHVRNPAKGYILQNCSFRTTRPLDTVIKIGG